MLDLAINGVDLGRGRGGNESYLQGLIGGLVQLPDVRDVHTLVSCHYSEMAQQERIHYVQTGGYHRIPYLLWTQTQALRKLRYDWFLSTYFLPARTPRHSALLVHDLSFLSLPESYPASIRLYMQWLVARAVRQAEHIFVLSQYVLSEFARYYSATSTERTTVLYPGIDRCYQARSEPSDERVLGRHALKRGYILAVSNIHPRKNLHGLLEAYRLFKQGSGAEAPALIVAGQRYWGSESLQAQAAALGVRLLGYVPKSDLPALYRGARVFVYPSLYEGFGLPPVEAMACGVPVICGNNSSLPEAVGSAALTVNVQHPQEISRALETVLLNEEISQQFANQGLEQAKQFSWLKTATRFLEVLTA